MPILKYRQYDFTFDFFQKAARYPFYETVRNKTNDTTLPLAGEIIPVENEDYIHVINDIPPYFELSLSTQKNSLKSYEINKYTGFLADLKNYRDIDSYVRDCFRSKNRSNMMREKRRLETCFEIEYKMYYGEISEEEFDFLFDTMKKFIGKRFSQRGDTHSGMEEWSVIKKNAYPLILSKRASLFVIYNGNNPIDICLNYHYQNIMNHMIRSYDIDYSKYRLGYIDLLQQIEWCILNNFNIFDLSRGEMDYKKQWCNTTYHFKSHIIYKDHKLLSKVLAYTLTKFFELKEFLKRKNVPKMYSRIINTIIKKQRPVPENRQINIETKELLKIPEPTSLRKLNINNPQYSFLRKPVYDFQYLNSESYKHIGIYMVNNTNDTYMVIGKKKSQQIRILS